MRFFLCGVAKTEEEAAAEVASAAFRASLNHASLRRVWTRRQGCVYAVLLSDTDGDTEGVVELADGRVVLWSGYVGTGDLKGFLARHLRGSRTQPSLTEVSGGIAAFALVDFEYASVNGWCSQPGVEPIYYSPSKLSNRPLAVCSGQPEFNLAYLDWYMTTGYSMDSSTPFKGVSWILSGEMIRIDGKCEYRLPHPNPAEHFRADMGLECMIEAGIVALEAGIAALSSFTDVELFLSNGKDSRLLAAALYHCRVKAQATTMALSDRAAFSLVKRIAHAAEMPVVERQAGFRVEDAHETLATTLRQSEGLLNCEANVDMVPWPTGFGPRQAIIFGHSHLQKGGLLRGPVESAAHAANLLGKRFDNPLASEVLRARVRRYVSEWVGKRSDPEPGHAMFWAAHDFRVTHYLRAHYQRTAASGVPVYPLIDERFARLCGASDMTSKMDESFMFGMIVKMCPQMRNLPTATIRWKFEQEGPSSAFPDYDLRAVIQSDEGISASPEVSVWNSAGIVAEARDAILGGSLKDELLGRVEKGMSSAIVSWGRGGFYPGAPSRRRARIQLFRMYAATLLCDEIFRVARERNH